jgi:hypothetical protein
VTKGLFAHYDSTSLSLIFSHQSTPPSSPLIFYLLISFLLLRAELQMEPEEAARGATARRRGVCLQP